MSANSQQKYRQHKRIPFLNEVEIQDVGIFRSLEIGVGGMYIETIIPYPIGTVLDLRFRLNNTDDPPINVLGSVLYSHRCLGIGIRFLDLKAEDRARIEKFIFAMTAC
jgi:hypothetical protein